MRGWMLVLMVLAAPLWGQADKRSITDYFVGCPWIIPSDSQNNWYGPDQLITAEAPDTPQHQAFRRSLLTTGKKTKALEVTSVIVDTANAYISIEGTNSSHEFSLQFVYFERADKSRIPAYSYHFTATEDDIERYQFFDLRGGGWKPIAAVDIAPGVSVAPLRPYLGKGSEDTVEWRLELPRYGTTVRFLPFVMTEGTVETAEADYIGALDHCALECAWDKPSARFRDPLPALRDASLKPKSSPVAADFFPLLPPREAEADVVPDNIDRAAARDAWKAKASNPATVFSWSPEERQGVSLAVLGRSQGMPLVAEIIQNEEIFDWAFWRYHADSGLLEPQPQPALSIEDFYKKERWDGLDASWKKRLPPVIESISEGSVRVSLDVWHDPDLQNYEPDYVIDVTWDGTRYIKTAKAANSASL